MSKLHCNLDMTCFRAISKSIETKVQSIAASTYHPTAGGEVDLILEIDDIEFAIEIKASAERTCRQLQMKLQQHCLPNFHLRLSAPFHDSPGSSGRKFSLNF